MTRYIKSFQNAEAIQEAVNNEELLKPYVAYNETTATIDYNTKNVVDYKLEPLTFKVTSNGNITWKTTSLAGDESFTNPKTILYSINNGEWVSLTSSKEGVNLSVNAGDIVKFKGDNQRYCTGPDESAEGEMLSNGFTTSCQFEVRGNIMSLVNSNNFSNLTTVNSRAFLMLFGNCTGLTDASKLVLPATTLAEGCYQYMFRGCSNLNYIKCLATDISASNCVFNWLYGVSTSGTFVKAAGVNWPSGASGIPTGWSVEEI